VWVNITFADIHTISIFVMQSPEISVWYQYPLLG